jgi:hypothetical protein
MEADESEAYDEIWGLDERLSPPQTVGQSVSRWKLRSIETDRVGTVQKLKATDALEYRESIKSDQGGLFNSS